MKRSHISLNEYQELSNLHDQIRSYLMTANRNAENGGLDPDLSLLFLSFVTGGLARGQDPTLTEIADKVPFSRESAQSIAELATLRGFISLSGTGRDECWIALKRAGREALRRAAKADCDELVRRNGSLIQPLRRLKKRSPDDRFIPDYSRERRVAGVSA